MNAAGGAAGGSQARGLAVTVVVAAALALVGASGSAARPGRALLECPDRVDLRDGRGTRQICATDPSLADCPPAAPGDLLERAGGGCRRRPQGMVAADRLLVGLPLDLNAAAAADLALLDGIGPILAARIVVHRRAHGAFTDVAQLERVKGIGPRTLARVRPQLTVGAPRPPNLQ